MKNQHPNRTQFLIQFGYLGYFFHGVQPQKDVLTAGEALYQHLTKAAQAMPKALQFSARTDKGVHALMNVATCWFKKPFDASQFIDNVQSLKTPGLLAVRAKEVPSFVHARGSAKGKHYRYVIEDECKAHFPNPFVWQIAPILDINRMQEAALHLLGQHDFSAFRALGCSANSTVKTIHQIQITRVNQNSISKQIHIDISGDAFLRQMIRIMVGLFVEIGAGLRKTEDIVSILNSKDRRNAGLCAPAHGLTLMQINFFDHEIC